MRIFQLLIIICLLLSCSKDESQKPQRDGISFKNVEPDKSGLIFSNIVKETKSFNYFTFEYIFNGGGVAVGDINNDGLEDVYLSSNLEGGKLFLNKGDLIFEDITAKSNIETKGGWNTGVNMIDVNQDGYLDLYVCRSGWLNTKEKYRKNLLFINKGNMTFVEAGEQFGLAESGFSINSSFFDYDKDGDLDCYITNHPIRNNIPFTKTMELRKNPPKSSQDVLYRNEGGKFIDVSEESGIINYSYGLGLSTVDLDNDGWIDIYGTSDFALPDFLNINQKNGKFNNEINEKIGHISYFAMGLDIADINNDGYEDIYTTEMLPTDYKRSKTNMASMNVSQFEEMQKLGLHNQYMHNTLQLSRSGKYYSEISQYAKVNKSDWSWGCMIEDFDNDGLRDIYIANGYKRDYLNQDFKALTKGELRTKKYTIEQLNEYIPEHTPKNYMFKNMGDYKFKPQLEMMNSLKATNSQSMGVADFDLDGDLDIIVNNLDEPASLIENISAFSNYISIKLKPKVPGRDLNAKVTIMSSNGVGYHELKNARGYQSISSRMIHFGLGDAKSVDSIIVRWLDGSVTKVQNVKVNQTISISQKDGKAGSMIKKIVKYNFEEMDNFLPPFVSQEIYFDDYQDQVLLPHRYSRLGPFISSGDVDGDGKDDIYIGGSRGQAGAIYLRKNGKYLLSFENEFEKDEMYEDMKSLFVDVDMDGDLDLYVVSGGNEYQAGSKNYQDRLYLNDGKGGFKKSIDLLPEITSSGSCVVSADFNDDGEIDFFIGGRVVPNHYPMASASMLLLKENSTYIDRAAKFGLGDLGIVSDVSVFDADDDGDMDLLVAGEWKGLSLFINTGGKFEKDAIFEEKIGNLTKGWWKTIVAEDIDSDGDIDFIVGNKGLNSKYSASTEKPMMVYAKDFDNSGSFDLFLAKHYEDRIVPVRGKECSSQQIPDINTKFSTFESFADANIEDIIDVENAELEFEVNNFSSIILRKDDDGYKIIELPAVVQFSEVNSLVILDVNNDNKLDIIISGNNYDTEAETSRADASIGSILINNGNATFSVVPDDETSLFLNGNVKDMIVSEGNLVVSSNLDRLKCFKFR